jgi:predicted nucleic acid-binding protein
VIVVDTNVLYALAGRRDKHHAECTGWFRTNDEVLLAMRVRQDVARPRCAMADTERVIQAVA